MKINKFEIHFDNGQGVFDAGSVISGNILLSLSKSMKMRCISLHFEGKGKSHWEVRSGRNTTKYRGYENYLNETVYVFGTGQHQDQMHPEGTHIYPFSIQLNHNAPSSFEGRRGYVRYTCKAVIDRPWKFDESTKRAFTVLHHVDLNFVQQALVPIVAEQEETIQGCCCEEGRVKVEMKINKTGFVPGEHLIYDIMVQNSSENDISELQLELRQDVTYTGFSDSLFSSGNPHYHNKVDTFNLFRGEFLVRKGESKHLNRASIVPSLPPSRLEGCRIIDILYRVILKLPCGWTTIKLEKMIIIGTKPARVAPLMTQPQPYESLPPLIPTAPGEFSVLPTSPPQYDEPPPSYAECVFGRVAIHDENDDEHTGGDTAWAPAYPYYDWSSQSNQMFGGERATVPQYAPPPYGE